MTQRTQKDRRASAPGDRPGAGARGDRPRHRLRDRHQGRDEPGSVPRPRLGQRHRLGRAAQGGARGAATGHAVHPPRTRLEDQAAPDPRAGRPAGRTRSSAARASSRSSTSWRRAGCPRTSRTAGESLPTPVPRLPHEGDVGRRSRPPKPAPTPRKKRAWQADRGPDAAPVDRAGGRPGPERPAGPELVRAEAAGEPGRSERRSVRLRRGRPGRGGRSRLRDRAPRPDDLPREPRGGRPRLGPGDQPARRGGWGSGDARLRRSASRRCTHFLPGMDRFRREPDPSVDYDLLVVGDCGELERVGPVLQTHAELFGRVPDPRHRPPHLEPPLRSGGLGRSGQLGDVRDGHAAGLAAGRAADGRATGCWPRLWRPASSWTPGNFQHPNVTPRTLVVAAALREAGAPLSEIARRLYRTKPNTQLCLFGRVLARMESDLDGRLVWSTLELADLAAAAPTSGRIRGPGRPAGPVGDIRGVDPLQGSRRRRRASASGRATAESTRPC